MVGGLSVGGAANPDLATPLHFAKAEAEAEAMFTFEFN